MVSQYERSPAACQWPNCKGTIVNTSDGRRCLSCGRSPAPELPPKEGPAKVTNLVKTKRIYTKKKGTVYGGDRRKKKAEVETTTCDNCKFRLNYDNLKLRFSWYRQAILDLSGKKEIAHD